MSPAPVIVGGRELPAASIAAELQHHPASSREAAWNEAARALAIRQLLVDEAERLSIAPHATFSTDGQRMADEDAAIDALLEREVRTPHVDEAACRRFHAQHADRFCSPLLVEAAHILVAADPADALAMGFAVGDARELIRQLHARPDLFGEVARTRSACPSGTQGGNLGQIGPGQLVKPLEDALFALSEETLCPHPVKSPFGVHVVRAGRRAEPRPLPFEAVCDAIHDYLEESGYRRAIAQYLADLARRVEVSGVDLGKSDNRRTYHD